MVLSGSRAKDCVYVRITQRGIHRDSSMTQRLASNRNVRDKRVLIDTIALMSLLARTQHYPQAMPCTRNDRQELSEISHADIQESPNSTETVGSEETDCQLSNISQSRAKENGRNHAKIASVLESEYGMKSGYQLTK